MFVLKFFCFCQFDPSLSFCSSRDVQFALYFQSHQGLVQVSKSCFSMTFLNQLIKLYIGQGAFSHQGFHYCRVQRMRFPSFCRQLQILHYHFVRFLICQTCFMKFIVSINTLLFLSTRPFPRVTVGGVVSAKNHPERDSRLPSTKKRSRISFSISIFEFILLF